MKSGRHVGGMGGAEGRPGRGPTCDDHPSKPPFGEAPPPASPIFPSSLFYSFLCKSLAGTGSGLTQTTSFIIPSCKTLGKPSLLLVMQLSEKLLMFMSFLTLRGCVPDGQAHPHAVKQNLSPAGTSAKARGGFGTHQIMPWL